MRKQARSVLSGAAALIVGSLGGALADEAPKLTPRLDEAPFAPLMDQGFEAVKAGKPADALVIFTEIDQKFTAAYAAGPRVYCSHNARETVINMTRAAADSQNAISIGGTWCDAIYFKAYALIDLDRPAEAASELDRALKMSPDNPQYLDERAELLMRARHFDEALAMFKLAEIDHVYMTSEATALATQSRSCRGIGFVLTEQGELDESEVNYHRCLTLDPNDEKSKDELAYIAKLRQKKK
jgi:tetratricopeptide (TPR) repeat protein